jgi:NDP-sugar pyrophosphorylase family protein
MQALMLAGGKGTRLRPYTTVLPKPLMPVGDFPIIEIMLRQLRAAGVEEVVICTGHLPHLFEALLQDGRRYGLRISYSVETEPLGTAGPIGLVLDRLQDDFLVMNGDILTTLSYRSLFEAHLRARAAATIGVARREVKIDFGVISSGADGLLERYTEKPVIHYDVSMGINVLSRRAVAPHLEAGGRLDLPDLMMRLHREGKPVLCHREPCYWLDIGRVDDYQTASDVFAERRSEFLPGGA